MLHITCTCHGDCILANFVQQAPPEPIEPLTKYGFIRHSSVLTGELMVLLGVKRQVGKNLKDK